MSRITATLLLLLGSATLFSSCEKKEAPYPLPPKGDAESIQFDLGSTYQTQVYYSFSGGVVSQNAVADWDIAFSTRLEAPEVWLNGRAIAYAFPTDATDIHSVVDSNITDLQKKYDDPAGEAGSSALGNLAEEDRIGKVMLINVAGTFYKLKVVAANEGTYTIQTANMDGGNLKENTLTADTNYNFIFYSFANGVTQIEPPKAQWDILFTQYQHVYRGYNPDGSDMPYPVVGALLNPYRTAVAVDSSATIAFNNYSLDNAEQQTFTANRDAIGYSWKTVNINTGQYVVESQRIYLISDQTGALWKMHFTSYYNASGEKGSPQFEFLRLK